MALGKVCLVLCLVGVVRGQRVRVDTKYGPVDGLSFPLHTGNSVTSFLAVPFAKAPLAELRWRAPEEPEPWTEPLDAVNLGPACIQNVISDIQLLFPGWTQYSEDCLHLSIFAPSDLSQAPYPVMVWIHGGGNWGGHSSSYPGYFLADRGTVVVALNYRLNIFGFGSTKDDVAPGNYGLLDQIQALQFVQENIAAFGGNPEQVTIFGESAGGLDTGMMLMSPLAKGLFHQAILQSGTEFVPWGLKSQEDEENYMKQVGEELDCETDDGDAMMDCLRTKNPQRLLRANLTCTPGYECDWQPVVDAYVIPDTPRNLRARGEYNRVPEMIGINSEDAFIFLPPITWNGLNRSEFEDLIRDSVENIAPSFSDPERFEDMVQAVQFMYTPWPLVYDRAANRETIGRLLTDYLFGAPADYQAKLHSADDNDVYYYVYSHIRNATLLNPWRGSVHAAEIPYVFGHPLMQFNEAVFNHTGFGTNLRYDDSDVDMSNFLITLWTNFAKFGNPTPAPVSAPVGDDITWPLFGEHSYLWVGTDVVEERSAYRQDYYAFLQYYSRYLGYEEEMP